MSILPKSLTKEGVGYGRRRERIRMSPEERRQLRYAIPQKSDYMAGPSDLESIWNRPRANTPEYKQFLKTGSRREGTLTARQTGARQMANEEIVNKSIEGLRQVKNRKLGLAREKYRTKIT